MGLSLLLYYSPSEFWIAPQGADEELSDRGSLRVIVYGYDRIPTRPVAPPSPYYIPGLEEPQTPPVPQDEDEQDGPVDYLMDKGDDGDDDDGDSSGDDADDEEEDEEDEEEEEEEEHLAPADSAIVIPTVELVSLPEGTEPVIPPPSTDTTTTRARITVQLQAAISIPPEAEVLIDAVTATLPSPPLLPPLYIPPPVDRRDDIPETKMPPRKRIAHQETILIMKEETYATREAWAHTIGLSQTPAIKESSTGPSAQAQDDTSTNIIRDSPSPADAETDAASEKTNSGGDTKTLQIDEEQGKDLDEKVNLEEKMDELDQGQAGSDPGRTPESRPPPKQVVMDEDQARPDPREIRKALAGPDPGESLGLLLDQTLSLRTTNIPHKIDEVIHESVREAVHEALQAPLPDCFRELPEADMKEILHQHMFKTGAVDWAMQVPLRNRFRDLPEADMKEILHQRMWETDSYKSYKTHMQLFEALEKPINRDQSEELAYDLAEVRKKRKKGRESPKMPPGSPSYQPPPPPPAVGPTGTSRAHRASGSQVTPPPPPPISTNQDNIVHLQFQMEECYKMLTDQNDWANPEGDQVRTDISKPLPLSGLSGHVTIQTQFFFNHDLDYLRYGSKGSGHALSISKMKAACYLDFGLELLVIEQMWINEVCTYNISASYGISHWWFNRQKFYIDRHIADSSRKGTQLHEASQ
nr:hypothetical protein [Tanacetum cinerariifolium]